ncbi:hepatic lectin-like [Crassostrea angulata]|uniref:hepatic lectin-like n=1 Tax=Magallana angulata TaxID=2784310 RepID=UPI0022B20775|nr:hepatic lectin-like [Crassostrea angulata]
MMFPFLFLLLVNAALSRESEKLSERYLASKNVIQFTKDDYSNVTGTPVTYYDITTLSECAVKSLMVQGSSFFYSGTEKTCVLTGRFPPGTFSPEYKHYIKDEKEKQIKECYYQRLKKQESLKEAKRKCKLKGGYVLEINSEDENNLVKDMFKDVSLWLGAVQIIENNTFRWERSGEMTFTDWSADYPIIRNTLYNFCVILTWSGWKNVYCSYDQYEVVCEFDTCG